MKKHILTVGLRRSGTTAFWELFRQDKRFLSFDEPFNSLFWWSANGNDNGRKTCAEFAANKEFFLQHGSHIDPCQETAPILFGHQLTYLKQMFELNPHVNVNETRLHNKVDILKKVLPDALIILLVRDPRAWITSQLKPKGHWQAERNLPESFFKFEGNFDHWRYQYIAAVCAYKGFAHEKLAQCWRSLNYTAVQLKPDMVIQFEDFCTRPEYFALDIYDRLDLRRPDFDYSIIHKANKPYKLDNNHSWSKLLAGCDIKNYIWENWEECEESEDYLYENSEEI